MADVPAADIAEVDVAVSGRQGITAAAESLRSDGVVVLRRAVDPVLLASLDDMVRDWHDRFLSGSVHNYSLGEETARACGHR
jgi:hypothetical protein